MERYSREISKRFVKDYNLPIPILNEDIFEYHLKLYEEEYGTMDKWNALWKLIDSRFDGESERFIAFVYDKRDEIINTLGSTDAFQAFNTSKQSNTIPSLHPRHNSVYIPDNDGKWFLSVDLSCANFNALRYADENIVLGAKTYKELIEKFTDIPYIADSKYLRQVIFGKLNPSRHIAKEKEMIAYAHTKLERRGLVSEGMMECLNTDEVVYSVANRSDGIEIASKIPTFIERECGFPVKAEVYQINYHELFSVSRQKSYWGFYVRDHGYKSEIMSVPLPFHSLVYNLIRFNTYNDEDLYVPFEKHLMAKLMDSFYIK